MNQKIELVDLVDCQGQVKKQSIPRHEAAFYPEFYLQIIIGVIFDKTGRILVHQRSQTKKVNPGDIDHICGGVLSGETPLEAAAREALEEAGVQLVNLKVISQGINKYNRFRYLLVGETNNEPKVINSDEVQWVQFIHLDELKSKHSSGEFTFVDEFFEDTDLVVSKIQAS